ncbi:MAG: hypothetical protein P1U68_12450 [Verrucomicrobiales bacterium]|nr:hypothetical protein [Verrucomicrobiales bacterium]
MLSNRPVYGRTFHTAMWTIGLVAAVQLFAVIWAVMTKPEQSFVVTAGTAPPALTQPFPEPLMATRAQDPVQISPMTEAVSELSSEVAEKPAQMPPGPLESIALEPVPESEQSLRSPTQSTNPMQGLSFVGPADTAAPSLSESLSSAAFEAEAIQDPILERLVSAGEELRAAGNMSGALQALREAESALPEHPRILAEMGATFSQMGLDERATVYWEKLMSLGAVRAGAYYELAERQLKGEQAPAEGASGQLMRIGEIKVEEESPGEHGQKVSLRIVVDADPANRLEGSEMSLLVYFYDEVDGTTINPSTADTSYDYPSVPYDWIDGGKEEIIVDYQQPVFTEEEVRELGIRRYYGYVIELYYRDRLQDRIEMPEELSEFRVEASAEPEPIGPQNTLFPTSPDF